MPLHDTNLTLQVQYPRELSQKGENPLVESDLVGLQISVSEFFSVLVEGQQRTNKIQFLLSWASREVCTSVSQQVGFWICNFTNKEKSHIYGLTSGPFINSGWILKLETERTDPPAIQLFLLNLCICKSSEKQTNKQTNTHKTPNPPKAAKTL